MKRAIFLMFALISIKSYSIEFESICSTLRDEINESLYLQQKEIGSLDYINNLRSNGISLHKKKLDKISEMSNKAISEIEKFEELDCISILK